jgi:hypothetical protein
MAAQAKAEMRTPPAAGTAKPDRASEPARGTPTVTVACKIPAGLRLTVFEERTERFPAPAGNSYTETISRPMVDVEPITIHGTRANANSMDAPKASIVGGYALTHGVNKAFWDLWLEQNQTTEIVTNRLVFAFEKADTTRGVAKDNRAVLSGLEPLNMGRRMERVGGKERSVPVDPRLRTLAKITSEKKADDVDDE